MDSISLNFVSEVYEIKDFKICNIYIYIFSHDYFLRFPGQPPLPAFLSQNQNTESNHNSSGDKNEPNAGNPPSQDTFSYFMRNMVNAMAQGNNVSFSVNI